MLLLLLAMVGAHGNSNATAQPWHEVDVMRQLERQLHDDPDQGGRRRPHSQRVSPGPQRRRLQELCVNTAGVVARDRFGNTITCADVTPQLCLSPVVIVHGGKAATVRELCPVTCGICQPGWNNSAAERRALEALYESAGGPGWVFEYGLPNNWRKGQCHCQWTSVLCRNRTACNDSPVVAVKLFGPFHNYGLNASGTLPGPVFAGLTELEYLGLAGNPHLSGSLPAAWGRLTAMRVLALRSNHLSGSLPEAWANMSKMRMLALHQNYLTGSLPDAWATMASVRVMYLRSNRLRGFLPETWATMSKMEQLYLYSNRLSGSLPAAWAAMAGMARLDLNSNQLSGTLPKAWAAITGMQTLSLRSNRLSGSLPAAWGSMVEMQRLALNSNQLSGPLPADWSTFADIVLLSLKSNNLDGTLPRSWGHMSRLQQIYLQDNRFRGSIPDIWGTNLTELQVFAAQQNALGGTIPEALLAGGKRCIVLLNDNHFRGRITKLSPGFFRSNCTIGDGRTYSSWFRPSLLLQNNRLSCALPESPSTSSDTEQDGPYTECDVDQPPLPEGNIAGNSNLTHAFNSILLPGNRFEGNLNGNGSLPSWVYGEAYGDPTARAARLLYLHRGEWWRFADSFTIPAFYLLVGLVTLAAATFRIRWCRQQSLEPAAGADSRTLRDADNDSKNDGGVSDNDAAARALRNETEGTRWTTTSSARRSTPSVLFKGLVVLVACALLVSTPAYFAGANYYECGDAANKVTSAYLADNPGAEAVASASLIATALVSLGIAAVLCTTSAETADAPAPTSATSSAAGTTTGAAIIDQISSRSAVSSSSSAATVSFTKRSVAVVVWSLSLLLLSGPSFIYSMTSSVPTKDSILRVFRSERATADLVEGISKAAPILLTVINTVIIPPVVRWCSAQSGWPSSWLLLTSRLLTTWAVPAAAIVVFSNSCGRSWLRLWNKCSNPNDLDVVGPSVDDTPLFDRSCFTMPSGQSFSKGYTEPETLVSGTTTCNLPSTTVDEKSHEQPGQCGRAVIETLAPLLINKMAISVFLVPAVTILRWRLLPLGVRGTIRRLFKKPAALQAKGKRLSLDNLMAQHLTWFDLAIVFGPHIPLLLPLTLATLAMSRWTHRLGIEALGLAETRADHARLSTWYVLMGVMWQQALSAFVFAGATITGWQAVVAVGVVVCTGCVGLAVAPAAWLLSIRDMCCCGGGCCGSSRRWRRYLSGVWWPFPRFRRQQRQHRLSSAAVIDPAAVDQGFEEGTELASRREHNGGRSKAQQRGTLQVPLLSSRS